MWQLTENKGWNALERQFEWVRRMDEVPQDANYHAEGNVAVHTKMVLTALTEDPDFQALAAQDQEILWAAALLHDVEKYSTTVIETDGRISSPGHARKGAQTVRKMLYRELNAPFEVREQIAGLVRHHGLPIWLFEKADPQRTLLRASFEVNLQLLTILARADMQGRTCEDQEEMLYRVACFEEYCRERGCWSGPKLFDTSEAKVHYFQNEDSYINYVPFEVPAFQVIVMCGLPGAGKDRYIKEAYKDFPVVSLDEIRTRFGVKPTDKTGNGKVIQHAKELARSYLRMKKSFVWNATNVTLQMRSQLIELFLTYKAHVKLVYVEVPYQQLMKQNKNREAMVPELVMEKLIDKLEVPKAWEAHEVVEVSKKTVY
ncbi:MAG: AAA family ATPase [Bacteroidota bacterium]